MTKLSPHKLGPQIEMVGGKSPRQRIWEAIRKHRPETPFTPMAIESMANTAISVTDKYLALLEQAGFIQVCEQKSTVRALRRFAHYKMLKDNGIEAPRIDKHGNLNTEGSSTERMWNTMRRMFKTSSFTVLEIAELASTSTKKVAVATAKKYIESLAEAGYLTFTPPNRYTLLAHMNSGSRAPICQKTKVVYDPNLDKIIWAEQPGEQDE